MRELLALSVQHSVVGMFFVQLRLLTDIYGIGFITADAIARDLGIALGQSFATAVGCCTF
jgi:transposase